MNNIYLDHAATTPLHEKVIQTISAPENQIIGNPSSIHSFGRKAKQQLEKARRVIGKSIGSKETDITFTSGGTEANNLALIGTAFANKHRGNHIITTQQEHPSILDAARFLEDNGFKVTYLPVNANGKVVLSDLLEALKKDTILVSIMFANNETGVLQPIQAIGELLADHSAYFHTDAVQAYGLIDIDVEHLKVDMLTASSHKINGPSGVGFLYASSDILIAPRQYGGIQERKKRPGTENITGIIGFATATEVMLDEQSERKSNYNQLKEHFLDVLTTHNVVYEINGDMKQTLPSIVNISFPGVAVETFIQHLDLVGIAAASGSACTAGSLEPSHVLVAMYGKEDDRVFNSLRFSFGIDHSLELIEEAANRIVKVLDKILN